MIGRIKGWFQEYKYDILGGYSIMVTCIAIVFVLISIMFMAISNDLADVVSMRNTELEEVKAQRDYNYYRLDDMIQSHEDCIPKQQYIDDVEYLESVIRELRGEE